jgi:opacity protein-like surface antigen
MKKVLLSAVLAAALFCASAAAEERRMAVPTDSNNTVSTICVYPTQQEDFYVIFKAQDVNGGAHGPGFSYMKNVGYEDLAAGGKYERFCCSYIPG